MPREGANAFLTALPFRRRLHCLPEVERRLDVVEWLLRAAAAGHHDLAEAEHPAHEALA